MTKQFITVLLTVIMSVAACFADSKTYTLSVGDFTCLKALNNANVIYRSNPDSIGYAVFEAEHRYAKAYIFSNNKAGTLKIEVAPEFANDDTLPTVYVYSQFINKIESSSTSTVFIDTPTPCPLLKAKLIGNGRLIINNITATTAEINLSTGNGTIVANGTCSHLKIKTIGTGVIQADELIATDVDCTILGTGSIGCNPRTSLNVKGIGSTKIYYKGQPQIKKSGGGTLIPME